jgi:hypothetical protein
MNEKPNTEFAQQECSRRMGLLEKSRNSTLEQKHFSDKVPTPEEWGNEIPVFLYNVAHKDRSPASSNESDPGLRILGMFQNRDEALELASKMSRKSADVDYWICMAGQWIMLHVDRNADQTKVQENIDARLVRAAKRRDKNFAQLKTAKDEKLQSRTSYFKKERTDRMKLKKKISNKTTESESITDSLESQTTVGCDSTESVWSPKPTLKKVPAIQQNCTRVGQNFAVISVLKDDLKATRLEEKLPEPLVRIYSVFSSKKQAKEYITNTLSPHIGDFDLDIVDMYEWLYPQSVDPDFIEEEFRDKDMTDIINHAKSEKTSTKQFRERCKELGKEPDMAHVSGSNATDSIVLKEMPDTLPTITQSDVLLEEQNPPTVE